MSAAAAIREQIAQLEAQLAGLRMALSAVEGAEASSAKGGEASSAKAASAPSEPSAKVTVRKPHPNRRPVREDAAAAGTPGTEASEEDWRAWANAVSNYITTFSEHYPNGVPMPNVTNPGLYKECRFVPYPGIKGGIEQALIDNRFEIVVKKGTGGKLVKNRAA